jgi:hypothetical protein
MIVAVLLAPPDPDEGGPDGHPWARGGKLLSEYVVGPLGEVGRSVVLRAADD